MLFFQANFLKSSYPEFPSFIVGSLCDFPIALFVAITPKVLLSLFDCLNFLIFEEFWCFTIYFHQVSTLNRTFRIKEYKHLMLFHYFINPSAFFQRWSLLSQAFSLGLQVLLNHQSCFHQLWLLVLRVDFGFKVPFCYYHHQAFRDYWATLT